MRRRATLTEGASFFSPRTGAWLEIGPVPEEGSLEPLSVRREFAPNRRPGREHLHLDVAETYTIERGIADARLDDLRLRLGRGEVLHVPAGVRHVNPSSGDVTPLRLEQRFEPATEGVRAYLLTLADVLRKGRDDDGELPWVAAFAVFDATRSRTYLARAPVWTQRRVLMPASTRLARRQGYVTWLPR